MTTTRTTTSSSPPSVALPCLSRKGPALDGIAALLATIEEQHAQGDPDYALDWAGDVLTLLDRREPRNQPLSVDWVKPLVNMRSFPASRKDPMARAVGKKTRSIIDATAGWGNDALRLVMMGYRVHLLERSPVIAALLADGLRRLGQNPTLVDKLAAPPTLCCCDAVVALADLDADCVYLDPMFPPRSKSSVLSKRPLRVLGEFAHDAPSTESLVAAARRGRRRVVVKRPDHIKKPTPPPDDTFAGKLVRFDVYLPSPP